MKLLILLSHSILAGILYRLGGKQGFNTKFRDFGIPLVVLDYLWLSHYPINKWLFLSLVLLFASLTTYWKVLNKIFKSTDNNVHWYSWFVTGLFYGLSFIPYFASINCLSILIVKSVILAVVICVWSEIISNVFWEEFGRGFFILPILFL